MRWRTEPRIDPVPAGKAIRDRNVQNIGKKLIWRFMTTGDQTAKKGGSLLDVGVLTCLNPGPQCLTLPALVRQGKQVAVIIHEADKRTAQNFRQRQVSLGQKRKPHQIQAILHRDVICQLQPVRASNRQTCGLQRRDHRIEQAARTASNEDQYVFRLHRAALPAPVRQFLPDRLAALHHILQSLGEPRGQTRLGRTGAQGIDGPRPGVGILIFIAFINRPEFHQSRLVRPARGVLYTIRRQR